MPHARLQVYPNPVDRWLQIRHDAGQIRQTFRILDATGRVVKTLALESEFLSVDLGDLSPGPYQLISDRGAATCFVKQ